MYVIKGITYINWLMGWGLKARDGCWFVYILRCYVTFSKLRLEFYLHKIFINSVFHFLDIDILNKFEYLFYVNKVYIVYLHNNMQYEEASLFSYSRICKPQFTYFPFLSFMYFNM